LLMIEDFQREIHTCCHFLVVASDECLVDSSFSCPSSSYPAPRRLSSGPYCCGVCSRSQITITPPNFVSPFFFFLFQVIDFFCFFFLFFLRACPFFHRKAFWFASPPHRYTEDFFPGILLPLRCFVSSSLKKALPH